MNVGLPQLRDELNIYQGPESLAGSPSWTVFDPVRNQFFKIDWPMFEILCRWELQDAGLIAQSVNLETSLNISAETVQEAIEFLIFHDLIKSNSAEDTGQKFKKFQATQQKWHTSLLHKYLFFRIPLWNPDQWLSRNVGKIRWLGSSWFLLLSLLVLFTGIIQVGRQWDSFSTTLLDMFSVDGLLAYAITIVIVKFIHELGHAFTAKHFGCKVPNMGIAFLVMFPMAYTDVNDAWKLPHKRQRLLIGAAGIRTELTIAAWATLAWALLPEGALKTSAFLLATTTWITTLLINASPFLRFDGYFLLMDSLEVPNLHHRAFALGKWRLREWLFRLQHSVPEHFSKAKHRFLILFAFGTWLYRLVLFLGIAVIVYLLFPKPLGPFLAFIEIYWFILKPILNELKEWHQLRKEILMTRRTQLSLIFLVLLCVVAIVPWDTRISQQGLLKPQTLQTIAVPVKAQIDALAVQPGDKILLNQRLMSLSSPDLEFEKLTTQQKLKQVDEKIKLSQLEDKLKKDLPLLQAQYKQLSKELEKLSAQQEQLNIIAKQSGVYFQQDVDLKTNDWVDARTVIGHIKNTESPQLHLYLPQQELERVAAGDSALFYSESDYLAPTEFTVSRIDTDATRVLTEPLLASTFGGEILVRQDREQLVPENAVYHIVLEPKNPLELGNLSYESIRGQVVISGETQAWIKEYYLAAMAVIRREAGF